MINPGELAICTKRGHDAGINVLTQGWKQCKWCGSWLRMVHTIEERQDEPPKEEQEPRAKP